MYADAASTDAVSWLRTFERAGIQSRLYARRFDEHHTALCEPLSAYKHRPGDVIVCHYTTWSETADFLLALGRPLILLYHNVTPPEFYTAFDRRIAGETGQGRDRLREFAPLATLAVAKSEFSRADLVAAGFRRTGVLPVRLDFDTLDGEVNRHCEQEVRSMGPTVLCLGRVVPNKRVEDVLRCFAYYRRIEPTARLCCVGAHTPGGPYQLYLDSLTHRLGLDGEVRFTGQVSHADRGAFLRASGVLVTMSEHEGFCVPIVEAMYLGLPVVAYAGGAIPETIGDAGVLVTEKRPAVIAEVIAMMAADTPLRRRMVAKGRQWASRFRAENLEATFAQLLDEALEGR